MASFHASARVQFLFNFLSPVGLQLILTLLYGTIYSLSLVINGVWSWAAGRP